MWHGKRVANYSGFVAQKVNLACGINQGVDLSPSISAHNLGRRAEERG
jgi:hypothetical protein